MQIDPRYYIPVQVIILHATIAMLLGLINLGSKVAFNAMTTLALIGHYTSYSPYWPPHLSPIPRFTPPVRAVEPGPLGHLGQSRRTVLLGIVDRHHGVTALQAGGRVQHKLPRSHLW